MTTKARSFRVSDETVEILKRKSKAAGRSQQVMLGAMIEFFDPENKVHMGFLAQYESSFATGELASKINDLSDAERQKLMAMLVK